MENKETIIQVLTEQGFKPRVICKIAFDISHEFVQGIQNNPLDQEELFNILHKELELLKKQNNGGL